MEEKDLHELRKKIFISGYRGGMAHLASCYSCLEMIYALYLKDILRYDPNNPKWEDRDRFVLSKGHAGLALYGVMMKAGLIREDVFSSYLQESSLIGGEPCMRDCPWVEATTGSLGHGLPMAAGMAMALKMNHSLAKVYVMLGDGECEEGTVWEAAMTASSFELDNLIVILDCNEIQKMDGHDMEAFRDVVLRKTESGKPHFIIAHTVKGKGISIMENNPNWHFKLPGRKELKVFKQELGIEESELE